MAKVIKQEVEFSATPHEVYEALMDSEKHAEFTGAPASIDPKVGGKFTAHGDYIEGGNLGLVTDEKIVQKWRGSDWPEGHYSTATFELKTDGDRTKLVFTQENVPDNQLDATSQGWYDFYWKPMQKYFENN